MFTRGLRTGIVAIAVGSLAFASIFWMACTSFSDTTPADGAPDTDSSADVAPGAVDTGVTDAATSPCAIGACRIVFVTSTETNGSFGGVDEADGRCQTAAATNPALSGRKFRAWLSDPNVRAAQRHAADNKPYVRVDGKTVAIGWNELTLIDGGVLRAPIQIDEKGANAGMPLVWTGTTLTGTASSNTCSGWTTTETSGQVGRADRVDEAWTDTDVPLGISGACNTTARLYCFEL